MRLTIYSWGASATMGQRRYELEVSARAADALGGDWKVRHEEVLSLRAPGPGTLRIPVGMLEGRGAVLGRPLLGRLITRGADVSHRMDLRLPPAPRNEVLTIHDAAPLRYADEGGLPRTVFEDVRRAARVVCPSRFAADEVSRIFGISTTVAIHNGIDAAFFDAVPDPKRLAILGLNGPYLLHTGGASERKNLEGLAQAWQALAKEYPELSLALVGPPHPRRSALFEPLERAHLLGKVSFTDLQALVAGAQAIVVPSVYEGFGIPALEAMAAGRPVVAADRSSLPEVCGDAALLVEPDGGALAEGVREVLTGGTAVEAMRARGPERARAFTWDRSAAGHARVWREVAQS